MSSDHTASGPVCTTSRWSEIVVFTPRVNWRPAQFDFTFSLQWQKLNWMARDGSALPCWHTCIAFISLRIVISDNFFGDIIQRSLFLTYSSINDWDWRLVDIAKDHTSSTERNWSLQTADCFTRVLLYNYTDWIEPTNSTCSRLALHCGAIRNRGRYFRDANLNNSFSMRWCILVILSIHNFKRKLYNCDKYNNLMSVQNHEVYHCAVSLYYLKQQAKLPLFRRLSLIWPHSIQSSSDKCVVSSTNFALQAQSTAIQVVSVMPSEKTVQEFRIFFWVGCYSSSTTEHLCVK